jgi:hypothetical protein
VIERESELLRIFHLLRADALELAHHRRRVVVGHAAVRTNRQEIPRPQRPRRPFGHVLLRDFFNDGLAHDETPDNSTFPLQLESQIHHLPNVMMQMRRALQHHLETVAGVGAHCRVFP